MNDVRNWNFSDHINFMHPDYIQDMEDVESICNTLFDNLYPGDGDGNSHKIHLTLTLSKESINIKTPDSLTWK